METWLEKLDVRVDVTVGAMDNYVYRVKYGQADMLAGVIMQLYMGSIGGSGGMGGSAPGRIHAAPAAWARARDGLGRRNAARIRRPGRPVGVVEPFAGCREPGAGRGRRGATAAGQQTSGAMATSPFGDSTGYYMGATSGYGNVPEGMPRVVPNIMDNSILIQATAPDYERILKLLKQLDVPPRQVLIEAKIYEVTLTGAFASGVSSMLQKTGSNDLGARDAR